MATFLRAPGNTDYPAAFQFANLPYGSPYRTGCGRHHQGFALFRLANIQQPHVGGKAWHSQHSQRPGGTLRVIAQLDQILAVGDVILLPAAVAEHPFTGFIVRVIRLLNAADRAAHHHRPDLHRRRVGWRIAHAAAHIRVQRQPDGTEQDLPISQRRNSTLLQAKIIGNRGALWTRSENPTTVWCRRLTHI